MKVCWTTSAPFVNVILGKDVPVGTVFSAMTGDGAHCVFLRSFTAIVDLQNPAHDFEVRHGYDNAELKLFNYTPLVTRLVVDGKEG